MRAQKARPKKEPFGSYFARPKEKITRAGVVVIAEDVTQLEVERIGPTPIGPGLDIVIEAFPIGKNARDVRWRNAGVSPLEAAHQKGAIDDEQYLAGNEMAELWSIMNSGGRDSTDLDVVKGGGGRVPFTDDQVEAVRRMERIERKLKTADYLILRNFCCYEFGPTESIRRTGIPFHPNGVMARICEAFDCLIGRQPKLPRGRPTRQVRRAGA